MRTYLHMSRWLIITTILTGLLITAGGTAAQPRAKVIADGLWNPRGLVVWPNGTVYVNEAGSGGPEQFMGPPNFGPGLSSRGTTATLTAIQGDETETTIASGLPSLALGGFEVIGPSAIVETKGDFWVVTGFAHESFESRPNEAAVLRIDRQNGTITQVADIGAYERANNPDGFAIEADLNGIAVGKNGMLYVGDAGGNALYQVDSKTGAIKLVTVFAGLPAPFPNPSRNNAAELDPVPTGVTVGPDGSIYVGVLSGFPFPQGAAKVVRVALDGTVTDVVTGLTAVVNVTFGPDGHLYIVEFGTFTFAPPDTVGWDANSGRVLRVRDDGTTEVVIDGLDQPYGIAFDKKGNLYVTNRTNYPPEAGPLGEVLRFDGVARKGNQR